MSSCQMAVIFVRF